MWKDWRIYDITHRRHSSRHCSAVCRFSRAHPRPPARHSDAVHRPRTWNRPRDRPAGGSPQSWRDPDLKSSRRIFYQENILCYFAQNYALCQSCANTDKGLSLSWWEKRSVGFSAFTKVVLAVSTRPFGADTVGALVDAQFPIENRWRRGRLVRHVRLLWLVVLMMHDRIWRILLLLLLLLRGHGRRGIVVGFGVLVWGGQSATPHGRMRRRLHCGVLDRFRRLSCRRRLLLLHVRKLVWSVDNRLALWRRRYWPEGSDHCPYLVLFESSWK